MVRRHKDPSHIRSLVFPYEGLGSVMLNLTVRSFPLRIGEASVVRLRRPGGSRQVDSAPFAVYHGRSHSVCLFRSSSNSAEHEVR